MVNIPHPANLDCMAENSRTAMHIPHHFDCETQLVHAGRDPSSHAGMALSTTQVRKVLVVNAAMQAEGNR